MDTSVYVTYEQALKLKELGFDEKTEWFLTTCNYSVYDRGVEPINKGEFITENSKFYNKACVVKAPTLAQVEKWLREKYNLYLEIEIGMWDDDESPWWDSTVYKIDKRGPKGLSYSSEKYETHEQALSSAIDNALMHIKK